MWIPLQQQIASEDAQKDETRGSEGQLSRVWSSCDQPGEPYVHGARQRQTQVRL